MDVEREVRAANRRIQAQIDRSHREALTHLGFDVDELRRQETVAAWAGLGQAFASFQLGMEQIARAIVTGYEEEMRRG